MPAGPVIANNTPLAALWAVQRLDLLESLFGEILIPQEVANEFLAAEAVARRRDLAEAPWIKVAPIGERRRVLAYSSLDLGEAEVLALAEETDARLLIIDEDKGRRFARRLGFPVIGTLGVLLLAKEQSLLERVAPVIEDLRGAGLYLAPTLITKVLHLASEAGLTKHQ